MSQLRRIRRIVDAAVELAERGGFEGVRLRDVAEASDVSLGTLYKYFRSKEDILLFAINEGNERLESAMAERPARGDTPVDRIGAFFARATRGLTRRPNFARAALRSIASGDPSMAAQQASYHLRISRIVIATIAGGAPDLSRPLSEPVGSERERELALVLEHVWFALAPRLGERPAPRQSTVTTSRWRRTAALLLGDEPPVPDGSGPIAPTPKDRTRPHAYEIPRNRPHAQERGINPFGNEGPPAGIDAIRGGGPGGSHAHRTLPDEQTGNSAAELREYYREALQPRAISANVSTTSGTCSAAPPFARRWGAWARTAGSSSAGPKSGAASARRHLEQFIFWDETWRARAPLPVITVNTVGPMIMQWGSEDQKAGDPAAKIRDGELIVSIGYTEPSNSGTDLASLSTTAVRDGDEWVINGQKVYTTHGHEADYVWLACRTDPDAPKHKGISIILVPTERPRVLLHADRDDRRRESPTPPSTRTFACPSRTRSGPINGGWGLITGQLNLERITLSMPASLEEAPRETFGIGRPTAEKRGGGKVIDDAVGAAEPGPRVCARRSPQAHELAQRLAHGPGRTGHGRELGGQGVRHRERDRRAIAISSRSPSSAGLVRREASLRALFDGLLESAYRLAMVNTFGGGVNEVMRDIIAAAGLQLPRARR